MQNFKNYDRRIGITLPKKFGIIIEFVQSCPELLICLRGKAIHIYYRGGKILDIRSRSMSFEEKYLKIGNLPTELKWLSSIKSDDVLQNPERFFRDAKRVMDLWFEENVKQERDDQHSLALNNRHCLEDGNLAVVDIEYAVSYNSNCYNKAYKDTFKKYERYPNPRFDIIAIDKRGQLYVLELKTGLGSTSNCKTHITDFVAMIGSHNVGDDTSKGEVRWLTFAKEIDDMIKVLNERKYRDENVKLPNVNMNLKPIFMFAFTVDNRPSSKRLTPAYQKDYISKTVEHALQDAQKDSNKCGLNDDVSILIEQNCLQNRIIYINTDTYKLSIL